MLNQFIRQLFRTMRRRKIFSSINILGLAIGLASTGLIFFDCLYQFYQPLHRQCFCLASCSVRNEKMA